MVKSTHIVSGRVSGLSLDHQTVSSVSRVRLSEREEESLSCFLRACDAALSYLQELDKVCLCIHVEYAWYVCRLLVWVSERLCRVTNIESKNVLLYRRVCTTWGHFTFRGNVVCLSVSFHLYIIFVFSDSVNTPHQDSQSQSASTCGHGAGLLPAGCITECLPLFTAEGVSLPTLHTHQHKHTHTHCLWAVLLCKHWECSVQSGFF